MSGIQLSMVDTQSIKIRYVEILRIQRISMEHQVWTDYIRHKLIQIFPIEELYWIYSQFITYIKSNVGNVVWCGKYISNKMHYGKLHQVWINYSI